MYKGRKKLNFKFRTVFVLLFFILCTPIASADLIPTCKEGFISCPNKTIPTCNKGSGTPSCEVFTGGELIPGCSNEKEFIPLDVSCKKVEIEAKVLNRRSPQCVDGKYCTGLFTHDCGKNEEFLCLRGDKGDACCFNRTTSFCRTPNCVLISDSTPTPTPTSTPTPVPSPSPFVPTPTPSPTPTSTPTTTPIKANPQCVNGSFCESGKVPDCTTAERFICTRGKTGDACCVNNTTLVCRVPNCVASAATPIPTPTPRPTAPQCVNGAFCTGGLFPDCTINETFVCTKGKVGDACCINNKTFVCRNPNCVPFEALPPSPTPSPTVPKCVDGKLCTNGLVPDCTADERFVCTKDQVGDACCINNNTFFCRAPKCVPPTPTPTPNQEIITEVKKCTNGVFCTGNTAPDCTTDETFVCTRGTAGNACCINNETGFCRPPNCVERFIPADVTEEIARDIDLTCEKDKVVCSAGVPSCIVGSPVCGSALGFTSGALSEPGCVNPSFEDFQPGGVKCETLLSVDDNSKEFSCSPDVKCPKSSRKKGCRVDKSVCECVCQYEIKGKKKTPKCKKGKVTCSKGNAICEESSNKPVCEDGKITCQNISSGVIDLADKVKCIE